MRVCACRGVPGLLETMGPARSRIARSTIVDRRRNDSRSLLCRPGRDLGSPRGCKENRHHGNGATFRLMFRKKKRSARSWGTLS